MSVWEREILAEIADLEARVRAAQLRLADLHRSLGRCGACVAGAGLHSEGCYLS